jgi:hypothetical protein
MDKVFGTHRYLFEPAEIDCYAGLVSAAALRNQE